ncbi:MAG: hypothetical protein HLUCCA13_11755 [Halomonas sp. HL-48]|nr:hypothetical protein [Halomonas sp. HL-48]KPQ23808.1 MAG: hypothetical protein HLUCCA13_11755 [Halomonas sp. HL-48]
MDTKKNIDPSKINKPIQLLGAWLAGLILVNGGFLGTAITIDNPVWVRGVLVIAAVVNVPVFLAAIFLLQTKFRPEMQEDSYYHDYLLNMSGEPKAKFKLVEDAPVKQPATQQDESVATDWSSYKVLVNPNIRDKEKIVSNLSRLNIPISGEFAQSLSPTITAPAIMFGRGFKLKNIIDLLKAMNGTTVQYVTYGGDEDEVDQYNNEAYIGPITPEYKTHGIPLKELLDAVEKGTLSAEQFYSDIIIAFNDGYEP